MTSQVHGIADYRKNLISLASNQIKIIFSTSTKTFTIPGWLGKYISCNMNIFEY